MKKILLLPIFILILLILFLYNISCTDDCGEGLPKYSPDNAHTISNCNRLHKTGLFDPLNNCTTCHGTTLTGSGVSCPTCPSCYTCHGQKW